jgi:hypothetical protein
MGKLSDTLRQMLAALERERHALAGLDIDAIMGTAAEKHSLCGTIERLDTSSLDDECRGLVVAARRLNETNCQVRNLVAANVAARLESLVDRGGSITFGGRFGRSGARLAAVPGSR